MALQQLANKIGLMIRSLTPPSATASQQTVNANGESITGIGRVYLQAESGQKTISSSGGKIYWSTSSATFDDPGTNLRIGIQDVGSTGIEDGTFDVYADLVGGTDTINSSTINITPMETGSKVINHGDIVGISIEMTTRGGTDTVALATIATSLLGSANFPYTTLDTGSGPVRNQTTPGFLIEFDDGTLGWLQNVPLGYNITSAPTSISFNTGSATDEYAAVFKLPFKTSISSASLYVGSIATTDNFEIILYSDPLGTPAVVQTATIDPNFTGSASAAGYYSVNFTPYTLAANTYYAIALRPTTANSITFGYYDLGSGNEKMKIPCPFGSQIIMAGRANQTGAFVETQVYHLPVLSMFLDKFDDGSGGGFFIQ